MNNNKNFIELSEIHADEQTLFDFTLFQSNHGALSKTYRLQDDGSIAKSSANMSSGHAHRITCTFPQFAQLLNSAKSNEAFAYGTHAAEYGESVEIAVSAKANPSVGILARTDKFFRFKEGPGVLMLDHDEWGGEGARLMPEEFLKILATIHPEIAHAAHIVRGSLSSGVHRSHEESVEKGFHVYILVKNAADISRYGAVLFDRLWLAGHGHITLASNGNMLVRSISDRAVHQGSRLDFVGQPVIAGAGLSWSQPRMTLKMGRILDTSTLADLSNVEKIEIERLQADAKTAAKPVADVKAVAYTSKKVEEMVANGVDESFAKQTVARINSSEHSILSGDFPLIFDSFGTVSVRNVLANPKKYDQQTLADPIEGLEYGRGKAIFYWNDGNPCIHSFAHGSSTYELEQSSFPDLNERPCYRVYSTIVKVGNKSYQPGVYLHEFKPGTEKKGPILVDKYICGELYVDAVTRDSNSLNFGRVLRFVDSIGETKTWDMPAQLLASRGDEMLKSLLSMGLHICYELRQEVANYICSLKPKLSIITTQQVGWHGQSFVLPEQIFGAQDVIFRRDAGGHREYFVSGTIEEWREHIGGVCKGNLFMLVVVSTSFAGALLKFRAMDGGGIHIFGNSSCGKTSILKAAASVWGHPSEYMKPWKSTSNGLEGHACLYNDGCLILDELSESDPREVDRSIYCLANGRGKLRAVETGAARVTQKWRVIALSSGEKKFADHLAEAKLVPKAGQLVRLNDIPVRGAHGVFDNLHGHETGKAFSNALRQAAAQFHGTAGPDFLRCLIKKIQNGFDINKYVDEISSKINTGTLSAQEGRTLETFSVIAAAGELASQFGITGWKEGEATAAVGFCFSQWRDSRGGAGDSEKSTIIRRINDYIACYGDIRFSNKDYDSTSESARVYGSRSGYWRNKDGADIQSDGFNGREWLFSSAGLHEATSGYDIKMVIDTLKEARMLVPYKDGKHQHQIKIQGVNAKYYVIDLNMQRDAAPEESALASR
jgi:putative DNA primase/helicase